MGVLMASEKMVYPTAVSSSTPSSVDVIMPASFWTIADGVDPRIRISYCTSIMTPLRKTQNVTLVDFMEMIKGSITTSSPKVIYEVFLRDYGFTNLYFDIDVATPGISVTPVEKEKILDNALFLVRQALSAFSDPKYTNTVVVSSAHRMGKISYHIIYPLISGKRYEMKRLVKLILSRDPKSGFDPAVYCKTRQLMRPVFCVGEKPDTTSLIPHYRYQGVFSDHIIQALRRTADRVSLSSISIPNPPPPKYVFQNPECRRLTEELIEAIDFTRLIHEERGGLFAVLKKTGFRELFDHKMMMYEDMEPVGQQHSNTRRLDCAWALVKLGSACDCYSSNLHLVQFLQQQQNTKVPPIVDTILRKYNLEIGPKGFLCNAATGIRFVDVFWGKEKQTVSTKPKDETCCASPRSPSSAIPRSPPQWPPQPGQGGGPKIASKLLLPMPPAAAPPLPPTGGPPPLSTAAATQEKHLTITLLPSDVQFVVETIDAKIKNLQELKQRLLTAGGVSA